MAFGSNQKTGNFLEKMCCSSVNMTNFATFSGKFCQICHITELKVGGKKKKPWV
jgi:hypothetical protein